MTRVLNVAIFFCAWIYLASAGDCEAWSGTCPGTSVKRQSWDMHQCSNGVCDENDCCVNICAGWTGTCAAGQTRRDANDYHQCSNGVCDELDCCSTTCGSFVGTCPGTSVKRQSWDMHQCSNGVCDENDCCVNICAGWTGTCAVGQTKRKNGDYHQCSNGVCDEQECCLSICAGWEGSCDASEQRRDDNDYHQCSNGVCDKDDCCFQKCSNWVGNCPPGIDQLGDRTCPSTGCSQEQCCPETCFNSYTGGCSDGKVLRENTDGHMCPGGWENCSPDECCRDRPNVWEEKCRTDAALDCSQCGQFSPCLSSVDPRCISPEALSCLHCDRLHNVTQCSPCAYGWDDNCVAQLQYEEEGCKPEAQEKTESGNPLMVAGKFDGSCWLQPPFASDGYQQVKRLNATAVGYKNGCNSSACEHCETSGIVSTEFVEDLIQPDICVNTTEIDNNEEKKTSTKYIGKFDVDLIGAKAKCPDGSPCGPPPCRPGLDAKCIVFQVYGPGANCSVLPFDATTGADFFAHALGDDTCRMDGSGRSWYKITVNKAAETGVGRLGCEDDLCSVGCTVVDMKGRQCTSPAWANGLELVAQYNKDDWPDPATDSPTSSPSMIPTNSPSMPPSVSVGATSSPSASPTTAPSDSPTEIGVTTAPSASPTTSDESVLSSASHDSANGLLAVAMAIPLWIAVAH